MNEQLRVPESFFTDKSYEQARAAGVRTVYHHVEDIHGMNEFLHQKTGRSLPAAPDTVDFVHYWSGGRWPRFDTHYVDAGPEVTYMPGAVIDQPVTTDTLMPKSKIEARPTTIVEIQTPQYRPGSLSQWLARAILTAHPKDAKFSAGPKAWAWTIRRALTTKQGLHEGFDVGHKVKSGEPALEAEAARRFPMAIILGDR